jgi:hypothetical protein
MASEVCARGARSAWHEQRRTRGAQAEMDTALSRFASLLRSSKL